MPVQSEWSLSAPQNITFEEPVTSLVVQLIHGTVNVVGAASGPARLELSELTGTPLKASVKDGTLTVAYEDFRWTPLQWLTHKSWNRTAAVTLTVPTGTRVEVGVADAGAVVSNISGHAAVNSVSGTVTLTRVGGTVRATTVSGALEAQGISGDLRFKSVSGDLTLVESPLDTVRADSVSGSMAVDLTPTGQGPDLVLSTISGGIAIRLPAAADTTVEANTTGGPLSCAFEELHVSSQYGARRITGSLGAGGGRLKVTSVSGAVALLRRPDTEPGTEADATPERPTQGKVL
ncbi:DUF4097 family beta strand repeat-containing protein [Streptomyces sp. UNOC14_S4]|uniref:DUF4097 family beta strand repeat-containing protein n=1 Tax=Streptomyces sp. UNOC14_S4 TaxID=2872340 RepID=UPI001E4BE061|nr:DUF4097 family beta strand repeat-containing protein [Streptomyces sp. UNOC14_S4]MCC3769038.1 DUF4097 family beta strand repeat protein [Streptomyces sp. UNOC14_S4]